MKVGRTLTAGRPHIALRRALVAAQVALSLVLLVAALLFGRSLFNLLRLDAGFEQAGILEADVDLSHADLPDEARRVLRRALLDRIRAIPDVDAAAAAGVVPLVGRQYRNVFLDGPAGRRKELTYSNRVGPEYFRTLGTSLVAGRDVDERDTPASPAVAVVNESFVRQLIAGNPLGATFRLEGGATGEPGSIVYTVVGVVENAKYANLREDFKPIVYLAESQNVRAGSFDQIFIRSRAPIATLMPRVKRVIESTNAEVSFHFHDFQEQIRDSLLQDRLMATLCGFFAVLAALLATIGVYGVMSYSVAQRTAEIGIRLALGAARRQIAALVLGEALLFVGIGLVIGLALALAAGRAADAMLFGLQPSDPLTLAAAAVLLAIVAAAAGYLPARRAARSDPMQALRCE
ncbi:MAG: FtsX-like permease family protein, partial [Vicinamibacterales bacterium]